MYTIYCNVPITRRKSFYLVVNEHDVTVFKDRHFWPCIEYLRNEGVEAYEIRPSEPLKGDHVVSLMLREENETWQSSPGRS